jgi:hypothetical protein
MADNSGLFCAECRLITGKCAASIFYPLNDTIEALEIFPNKATNPRVFSNGLIRSVSEYITRCETSDGYIINVWDHHFGYFGLQFVCDIVMEDRD